MPARPSPPQHTNNRQAIGVGTSGAWRKSMYSLENPITHENNGFPPRQTGEAMAVRSTRRPIQYPLDRRR
jgi:hypothetical protein